MKDTGPWKRSMKITGEKAAQAMEQVCATEVFQSFTKKDISVAAWGSEAKGTLKMWQGRQPGK